MNFDLVPRARACRRGFRGAAACAMRSSSSRRRRRRRKRSKIRSARGSRPSFRRSTAASNDAGPRRTAPQVRGSRRQPAGRARPQEMAAQRRRVARRTASSSCSAATRRQCGPLTRKIQQMRDNLDRIQVDLRAAARRSRRPSARVSAAPSWWRWRRTIAARSTSSRQRRRSRRAAAVFDRCSGRSRCSHRAAAAASDLAYAHGAERHLPHRLRAHLRRLLFTRSQPPPIRAALPRTKRPAAHPARPPRCCCIRTAIRARTSTRRCRSAASSPTRRCRMRSAIARRSIRAAAAGARARPGRRR